MYDITIFILYFIFVNLSRFFVLIFVNVENLNWYGVENCNKILIALSELVLNSD